MCSPQQHQSGSCLLRKHQVHLLLVLTPLFGLRYAHLCAAQSEPSTTIEAERSFSRMKRVKAWLRSTITSDRLSDLCVFYCHSERINDTEKINRVVACVAGGKDEWTFIVVVPYCHLLCVVNICNVLVIQMQHLVFLFHHYSNVSQTPALE